MEKLREETITCVRSCIISVKGKLTLRELERDYRMLEGAPIPFSKLGFATLEAFLASVPSLSISRSNGIVFVDALLDDRSRHIAMLVARQKNPKKKPARTTYSHPNAKCTKPPTKWRPAVNNGWKPSSSGYQPRVAQLSHNQFIKSPRKAAIKNGGSTNGHNVSRHLSFSPPPPSSAANLNHRFTQIEIQNKDETVQPAKREKAQFIATGNVRDDLMKFAHFHSLNEPQFVVKKRKAKKQTQCNYDCMIKVDNFSVSSYPGDFFDEQSAVECAAKQAFTRLTEKHGFVEKPLLPMSEASLVSSRLPSLIRTHFKGVWQWQVEEDYKDLFHEVLPLDWLSIIADCPNVAVREYSNKTLLKYCAPDKKDETISALTCDVSIPTSSAQFNDKGTLTAKITCAVSLEEIWCRQIEHQDCRDFEQMLDKMENYYTREHQARRIQPISKVTKGSYYAVCLQNWYRVRVIDVRMTASEAQCHFVDSGDDIAVSLSSVFELRREFARSPAQSFICRLAGLEDFYDMPNSSLMDAHIASLIDTNVTLEVVEDEHDSPATSTVASDNEILTVVMYNLETGATINEELLRIAAESAVPQLNLLEKTVINVQVSHIANNGKIYVQLLNASFNRLMEELNTNISAMLSSGKLTPATLTRGNSKGALYLGKLSNDDAFHRLRIIDSRMDLQYVTLFYVDQGRDIDVRTSMIKLYAAEDVSLTAARYPDQAILVQLQLGSNVPQTFDIREKIKDMVSNDASVLMRVVAKDDIPRVMLFVRVPHIGLVSVNDTITFEATELKPEQKVSKFPPSSGCLAAPRMPGREEFYDVKVPFAVSPWNFFVQPRESADALRRLMCEMQSVFRTMPKNARLHLDQVRAGDIYASKHENRQWYRVSVLKVIHATSISVFYVDYGYSANLTLEDLFQLDAKFMELPYQAMKAKLAGVKPIKEKWTVEDCKVFQEVVQNGEYVSLVIAVEKDELYASDSILKLKLIDTCSKQDVMIGDLLVQRGIAVTCGI